MTAGEDAGWDRGQEGGREQALWEQEQQVLMMDWVSEDEERGSRERLEKRLRTRDVVTSHRAQGVQGEVGRGPSPPGDTELWG